MGHSIYKMPIVAERADGMSATDKTNMPKRLGDRIKKRHDCRCTKKPQQIPARHSGKGPDGWDQG